ncbi:methyltransferase domain-containing protein [Candidatus Daviesbacteria bacterium]|nr:methyltransferase domain-containing protein [Candidatus Daviesbacteria bacterium]
MTERKFGGDYNPYEDYTIVFTTRRGEHYAAQRFARLFKSWPPEKQTKVAYDCLKKGFTPHLVVNYWITDEDSRQRVKLWCEGRGIKVEETPDEETKSRRARSVLATETQLIDQFSPYLSQLSMAKLLTVKKYRNATAEELQLLIGGTYRLLGDILGPRRHYRREAQQPKFLPLPELPDELFSDDLVIQVLYEHERSTAVPLYNQDPDSLFRYLREIKQTSQHPLKTDFINKLIEHFSAAENLAVSGIKGLIAGSQKDVPNEDEVSLSEFPSRHQREYAFRFLNKSVGRIDLLIGAPRTRKSGAAVFALEAAGAKATVLICPSGINKELWKREIQEKYEEEVEVLIVESERELRSLAQRGAPLRPRYLIMGYQLLSRLDINETPSMFRSLRAKLGLDSLLADEIQLAKEPEAECTKQLYALSRELPENAPRIAMTGTVIINSIEDYDAPLRILLPYRYRQPGDFTRALRNDPELVHTFLVGEELVTRWTFEEVFGQRAPVEYRVEPVPFTPFHLSVYNHVYLDDTIEDQSKRGFLRQTALDPLLIRKHYYPNHIRREIEKLRLKLGERQDDRERKITEARIQALEERLSKVTTLINPNEALSQLSQAHDQFIRWNLEQDENVKFDEDFLTRLDFDKLALWCFFNLQGGVDELVRLSHNRALQKDWVGKGGLYSSKYIRLREQLDEYKKSGDVKVIIGSGFYQSYVSSGIEDVLEEDELAFLSLYDYLRSWYGEAAELKIDGKVSIEPKAGELAERERIRRAWRTDPKYQFMLTTMRACRLGIDLSILPIRANDQIKKVVMIGLDDPDTYADKEQFLNRVEAGDRTLPVELWSYRTTNPEQPRTLRYGFIDHGIAQALEFKRLLSQLAQDGIPLTEEEETFLKSHLSSSRVRIELYPKTPLTYLNMDFFPKVRGKGAKAIIKLYQEAGFEGMTNADFFAAYYPQIEELGIAGQNARAVAEVIRRYQALTGKGHLRIGSIGAGSGILQNTLGEKVINVDLLKEILQVAKAKQQVDGDYITAEAASSPFPAGCFDVTDFSLAVHWTGNRAEYSERISALQELNRITRGLVTITIPHSYLTPVQFASWRSTLEEYFGFRFRDDLPSGLLRATDFRTEPISWIFNMEKVAQPKEGFSRSSLDFGFERVFDIITYSRENSGEKSISIRPYLPHKEFEIVDPGSGSVHKLVYQPTDVDVLEKALSEREARLTSSEVLTLSAEEFGTFRRLVREVRSLWGLKNNDAERLSLQALDLWLKEGYYRHDAVRIWSELKTIVREIHEGSNQ